MKTLTRRFIRCFSSLFAPSNYSPGCVMQRLDGRVLMDSTLTADFNADAHVNSLDFTVLAVNFNGTNKTHAQGDANLDTRVNAQDFNALAGEFGRVEPMPLTENDFAGGSADNDADYSLGHVPTSTEKAVFPASAAGFDTGFSAPHTFGELVSDEAGGGYDFSPSQISVLGNATLNNSPGNTLFTAGGAVAGTGNTGPLTIASKTGNGAITYDNDVVITDLGSAHVTVGASQGLSGSGFLIVHDAGASSQAAFTTTSNNGSPGLSITGTFHGEVVSNKTSGPCSVSLQGTTLAADATLTSQLNGVTVTDGTGGTFTNYTIASGNSQATQQSGSKPFGTALTGSYPAWLSPTGVRDQGSNGVDDFGWDVSFNTVAHTYSITPQAGHSLPGDIETLNLYDFDNSITIGIGTITVTAAATGGVPARCSPQLASRLAYLLN